MQFATKFGWHYPPHLRHVATLPWEIKTSNFLPILRKKQTNCISIASGFVFEGVHSEEVDRRISREKWTKRGVSKLFKKLRDTGTVNTRPVNGRPRSARTEENAKLLLQKLPQSATDFVLPIVRWSEREHLFVRKENKVSGILREHLKQKLSALHASSAVRVCQLLCTAPLETIQTQVLTNNLGQRRPMISHGQSCGSAACILDLGLNH